MTHLEIHYGEFVMVGETKTALNWDWFSHSNYTSDEVEILDSALNDAILLLQKKLDAKDLPKSDALRERLAIAIFSAAGAGERDVTRLRDSAVYETFRIHPSMH